MKILHYIIEIFEIVLSKDYKVISEIKLEEKRKLIARKICMSYARSNISLKKGNYLTAEDINARKEKSLKYVFKV